MTSTEERVLAHAVAAGIELPAIKVRRNGTKLFKTSSSMRIGKLVLAHAVAASIEPPAIQVRRKQTLHVMFQAVCDSGSWCSRTRLPPASPFPLSECADNSLAMMQLVNNLKLVLHFRRTIKTWAVSAESQRR